MAITIDKAFVNQYRDMVIQLSQQQDTRLRPHVTEVALKGEAYNFDRLAATAAVQKTERRLDTVYVDDTWSRRIAVPQTWNHTMTIEHEDKVQMLIEPESAYATNQGYAMARKWDDILIAAAEGTALDGEGVDNALPAGQVIGDGTGVISFDMITQVQETFLANEITPDIPKVAVIGPTQIRKLMQLTEQTSADYVRREALQQLSNTGIVPNWMGFTWILSNQLTAPLVDELNCLFFTKAALGLAVNQDVFIRIGENPAKSYMIQVFAQFTGGAIRIEDEQIVLAHVADTM